MLVVIRINVRPTKDLPSRQNQDDDGHIHAQGHTLPHLGRAAESEDGYEPDRQLRSAQDDDVGRACKPHGK